MVVSLNRGKKVKPIGYSIIIVLIIVIMMFSTKHLLQAETLDQEVS